MSRLVRRAGGIGAVVILGLVGATPSAMAEETPPACDRVALDAAVHAAQLDASAAQKAFTSHTKTRMQTLAAGMKRRELREARVAAHKATVLERKAARTHGKASKEARTAAKTARLKALREAKEAARVRRAGHAQLVRLVKVERVELRLAWVKAKARLATAKLAAQDCRDSAAEPEGDSAGN